MRIWLHIGLDAPVSDRIGQVTTLCHDQMAEHGILHARRAGPTLFEAIRHIEGPEPARTVHQQALRDRFLQDMERDIGSHRPRALILSDVRLGWHVSRKEELERIKTLLAPLSDDIRIVAQVEEQARAFARHHAEQVLKGRRASLQDDLGLVMQDGAASSALAPDVASSGHRLSWLDYRALADFWGSAFGTANVTLHPQYRAALAAETAPDAIRKLFDITPDLGTVSAAPFPPCPSARWLVRARQMNILFHRLTERGQKVIPPDLRQSLLAELEIDGEPVQPGALHMLSARFASDNDALIAAHPALAVDDLRPDPALDRWNEPDPGNGFRATQYLLAFMYRIDKATSEARKSKQKPRKASPAPPPLSAGARAIMPPLAVQNFDKLRKSPYAPHNRLGAVNEEERAPVYTAAPRPVLPPGSTGRVIVGCMKNEAPYIVEWIAYHRAIGVDHFLIYTNDCTDGTDEILGRLQEMGIVEHRNNDKWRGKSPQQHALNLSRKEPLIRNADWIIHIDVDEFINVRTGNGTLDDFFAKVPDATNVAMTWRLFGHNGVKTLSDDLVIDQFDRCAPAYCPKPHTAWGFKTMFRNIGAYRKISCHRPNQLVEERRDEVKWVNGSGHDMTAEVARNGWRNSRKTIGYDLLQLNHYALRSAESFLIKRQRGRALHVDRSIGINYWIRMDWSDFRDITIKRNLPRLRAEYDRLLRDRILRKWHDKGRAWHRAKADELHATPEFNALYKQALTIKLTETERVAYALALDMEN
ncbi:glycosyltransferase family 2 protein [Sedimentitalea sp. XS_ASV28]|uniref:glycosyltransferase family 2 protein n=1 Tax=Sedimentitalea sp. XS_ASV28 TaxID=3241296 RepID=UPI003513CDD1